MLESLYPKLPIFLQNLACTLYGWREKQTRFNADYENYLTEYLQSQYLSADEKRHAQETSLRKLLAHCQKTVPYYQDVFKQVGLNPDADDIVAELKKLPVLSKEDLRNNEKSLLSSEKDQIAHVEMHTSGTTGKALTLYRDKLSIASQWALCYRHRQRFGCQFGDEHVNFTGKIVVPTEQQNPPFWRHNYAFNQHLVNMQHINGDNIASIVGFLNTLKPVFYSGYPSIIAEVSRLALEHGLPLKEAARPKAVFAGAENTLDYQKEAIEAWTGAVVTDLYGLTEGNCHLSRCEHGNYHVDHEYGFVECVDGEMLTDGRIKGRLVGTSFTNFAMPLLRYDTGDMAIWKAADYQCPCGRQGDVIESIEGRVDDFVLLKDGKRVMRFDYLFKGTDDIKEAQVCQYKPGEVVFKLVSRVGPSKALEQELEAQFIKWITDDMTLIFEYVDRIPRSNTGKFKAVQSFL